jgi:SPOR domain
MSRLIFFLLLIANVALGAHIYLSETRPKAELPREINPGALKIVSVTDATKAQQDAIAAKKMVATLSGSACVDFAVKPADGARAQIAFAAMSLGNRLSSRNVEDFSRYAVTLPAQKDKRAADALVANLKKAGVKDVSALADNSISLGLYSSDEAAQKTVADLKTKAKALVTGVQVTPRNPQLKESLFTVREPDTNMIARLTLLRREFEGSNLRAVTCPAAVPVADVAPPPADSAAPAKK